MLTDGHWLSRGPRRGCSCDLTPVPGLWAPDTWGAALSALRLRGLPRDARTEGGNVATKTVTEGKRDEVLALRAKHHDMSLSEIGLQVGITRQRVGRIVGPAPRVTVKCDHCGREFEVRQSKYDLDTANGKRFWFCSRACVGPGMVGRMPHLKPEQVNQMPSTLSRSASVAQKDAKYKAKGLHLCPDGQPHHWALKSLMVDGVFPSYCKRCGVDRGQGGGEPWA